MTKLTVAYRTEDADSPITEPNNTITLCSTCTHMGLINGSEAANSNPEAGNNCDLKCE